ncbi:hypothetical protein B0H14DRAFT_3526719 [Mycena olivaceomarginata]|nr:hypothetical protein B0H14DRAFT_3526719 [Mycena olivaceomarginata]
MPLSLFRFVPPNVIMFAFVARETGFELVQSWAPLFVAIWAASAANDLLIAGTIASVLMLSVQMHGIQKLLERA